MSEVLTWSTTAASNSSSSPDGFPEDMPPSGVNNSSREVMAAVAKLCDRLGARCINLGFDATVASNDLTVSLKTASAANPATTDPVSILFRSTTVTTGQRVSVDYSAATTVVLPGGGSLGFSNSQSDKIHIWAVYDGTNKDIGVSRTANHDENALQSTTTIGTGSDATDTIYTTTGRTGAAITLIGVISIQYGTAAWTNSPTNKTVLVNRQTPLATDTEALAKASATAAITPANLAALAMFSGVAIQSFTTPGANTYTPTAGMKYCIAISTGGGGGGGGADTDGNSGIVGVGAGGGAGSTCIELFTAAQIGASQEVTIGAAGAAGSATGGTAGGNGGDTTFGALHTAGGGLGGTGSGVSTVAAPEVPGVAGGTATGGAVNVPGGYGHSAVGFSIDAATDLTYGHGGHGGASLWGGGGPGAVAATQTLTGDTDTAGTAGAAYGAGGGGALSLTSTTGAAGGAGMSGICIVIEFA